MLVEISLSNSLMAMTCKAHPNGPVTIRIAWPNHQEEIELPSMKDAITYLTGMAWFVDDMLALLKQMQKGDRHGMA